MAEPDDEEELGEEIEDQNPLENPAGGENAGAEGAANVRILTSPWEGKIDLSTKSGKILWNEGISPLEIKFTGYARDIARFLAAVQNRADKCGWMQILTFGTRKTLIKHYGEITLDEVDRARRLRDLLPKATHEDARPKINALMMFHFLYDSLGALPQKKLSTKLEQMQQDGPTLLKHVLDQTFVATQASTFVIKEGFYDLNLKRFKWNVQSLNQHVREKMADLEAAGHASDQTDVMIALFRAYLTSSNEDFKISVSYWKNEWSSKRITDVEELMFRADSKYSELRDLGVWGKRSPKDDQIIALTSEIKELKAKKTQASNETGRGNQDGRSNKAPKWKFDKSLSTNEELNRNNKKFFWCTGPGHGGIPMWVTHDPKKCKKDFRPGKGGASQGDNASPFDKAALTAALKEKGCSEEEIESKMNAIFAVFQD